MKGAWSVGLLKVTRDYERRVSFSLKRGRNFGIRNVEQSPVVLLRQESTESKNEKKTEKEKKI